MFETVHCVIDNRRKLWLSGFIAMLSNASRNAEATATVGYGERFPAKFGRTGFRRNFPFGAKWHGRQYSTKQVEVYAVQDGSDWLVITVITRYF
jgi:hypothetical protein